MTQQFTYLHNAIYDNVDRNLLMLNLLSLGLPHYFVLLLCEMYKYVKLVVKVAAFSLNSIDLM